MFRLPLSFPPPTCPPTCPATWLCVRCVFCVSPAGGQRPLVILVHVCFLHKLLILRSLLAVALKSVPPHVPAVFANAPDPLALSAPAADPDASLTRLPCAASSSSYLRSVSRTCFELLTLSPFRRHPLCTVRPSSLPGLWELLPVGSSCFPTRSSFTRWPE